MCWPIWPPSFWNRWAFVWSNLAACTFSCGPKSAAKKEKEPEAVVVKGAAGEVRVATAAVSNLAEKSAMKVRGVESAEAKVESRRGAQGEGKDGASTVAIGLDISLGAGENVAQVSDAVRGAVSEQMSDVLGLSEYSITVSVAEIADNEAAKKSRVS